jgi:hypothetical protein
MCDLPAQLREGLSTGDLRSVEQWWSALGETSRSDVARLWDERMDVCLFGIVPEEPGASAPVVIGGRFVPRDDAAGWAEWHAAYFDHLINNPELVFDETMVRRGRSSGPRSGSDTGRFLLSARRA